MEIGMEEVLLVALEVTLNSFKIKLFSAKMIPHMKLITIGIIYRAPNQPKFLDIF